MMRLFLMGLLAVALGVPAVPADEKAPQDPFQDAFRRLEEMRRQMEQPGLFPPGFPAFPEGFRMPSARRPATTHPRLGAEVRTPDGTLADQLDLPKGQGIVLAEVAPNSAAGKAGMKKHDILLELGGKPVPSKLADFRKMLAGLAADKPLSAVVMRKGTKETLKGVTLPEARSEAPQPLPGFPRIGGLFPFDAPARMTTITRTNNAFTATQKGNGTTLIVKGTIDDGKARVDSVVIDGAEGKKSYDALDKVPEAHRKQAEKLAALAAGKVG